MGFKRGTWWVKTSDLDAVRVLGAPGPAQGDWVPVPHRYDPPADDVLQGDRSLAAEPSRTLGEVVCLYANGTSNFFFYEHAKGGELLRKLTWAPLLDDDWTPGWICAQGTAETWEERLGPISAGRAEPEGDATLAMAVEKHFGFGS